MRAVCCGTGEGGVKAVAVMRGVLQAQGLRQGLRVVAGAGVVFVLRGGDGQELVRGG